MLLCGYVAVCQLGFAVQLRYMDAAEDHIAYQVFVSIIIAVAAVDITLQTIALPLTVSNIST